MAINDKTAGAGAFATAEYFRKKGAKHWAKAMRAKEEENEDEAKMNFKYAHYAYGRFHKAMDAVDRHGAAAEEHDRLRDEFLAEEDERNKGK